jgi:hypothetical protein
MLHRGDPRYYGTNNKVGLYTYVDEKWKERRGYFRWSESGVELT